MPGDDEEDTGFDIPEGDPDFGDDSNLDMMGGDESSTGFDMMGPSMRGGGGIMGKQNIGGMSGSGGIKGKIGGIMPNNRATTKSIDFGRINQRQQSLTERIRELEERNAILESEIIRLKKMLYQRQVYNVARDSENDTLHTSQIDEWHYENRNTVKETEFWI